MKRLICNLKINFLKLSLSLLAFFYVTNPAFGGKIDSLFQADKVLKMELRADFSAIQNDRDENPGYHNGELIYQTPGGKTTKLSVTVRARGNFRLNPANCKFPPLSVNFKKNEVKNTLFKNQNKLNLVTPCQDEENLIDEYIIYKMYNRVTDLSMKVRLVKILFFDIGQGKKVFKGYSFFIEEKGHVAERNNAFEKDSFVTIFDLNRENVKKMTVFQYIIGNKDWTIISRHNIVIMQPDDTCKAPYALPYDFDFSSFVNADYTKPKGIPEKLLVSNRVYMGQCYPTDEFNNIFEYYRELRPVFESIINKTHHLSKKNRKQRIKYLEDFYKVIESDDLIKQEFLDVCLTKKDTI